MYTLCLHFISSQSNVIATKLNCLLISFAYAIFMPLDISQVFQPSGNCAATISIQAPACCLAAICTLAPSLYQCTFSCCIYRTIVSIWLHFHAFVPTSMFLNIFMISMFNLNILPMLLISFTLAVMLPFYTTIIFLHGILNNLSIDNVYSIGNV